jgi:hypothetical protein
LTVWEPCIEPVEGGQRVRLELNGQRLTFGRWLDALASDEKAADEYTGILAAAPWPAFFWEHPPLTSDRVDAPLEFVMLDAPRLAGLRGDPAPFAAPFAASDGEPIVRFANLGGDAELVAPRPGPGEPAYPHLAAFVRRAPPATVRAFWRAVAAAIRPRLGTRPLWVSTSGLGVAWLHVRLDSVPKYYQFTPYRTAR